MHKRQKSRLRKVMRIFDNVEDWRKREIKRRSARVERRHWEREIERELAEYNQPDYFVDSGVK